MLSNEKDNYTFKDYWNLPDGVRSDLINGHLHIRQTPPSSVVVLGKFRCFHVPALFCDSFLPRFSPYLQKIFYAL